MELASKGRKIDLTKPVFHHFVSLSMSDETIWGVVKIFLRRNHLVGGWCWEPPIFPNVNPFAIPHPSSNAFF